MIIKCNYCNNEFNVKPSRLKRSKNVFCSAKCHDAFRSEKIIDEMSEKVGIDFKVWLHRKYIDEQLSTRQISDILYGTPKNSPNVATWLKKFNISLRRGSEAVKIQWLNNDERRKQAQDIALKYLQNAQTREKAYKTRMQTDNRIKASKTKQGINNPMASHLKTNTRLYNIWHGIKKRCLNPNDKDYKNYGGRGITICEEWQDNFQVFYDWAMINGYADDLTIDRINNDGGYEPLNCRWATAKEQRNNQRGRS